MGYDSLKLCGVAVIAAVAAFILRNIKSEFEIPLRVVGSTLLISAAVLACEPLVAFASELMGASAVLSEASGTLIKMLGIVWIVRIGGDICREMGAGGVAASLELVARIEIALLSLPLVSSVIAAVRELVGAAL